MTAVSFSTLLSFAAAPNQNYTVIDIVSHISDYNLGINIIHLAQSFYKHYVPTDTKI